MTSTDPKLHGKCCISTLRTSLYSALANSDFTGSLVKLSLNKERETTHIFHLKYGSTVSPILCSMAEYRLNGITGSVCSDFLRAILTPGWRSCNVLICSDRLLFWRHYVKESPSLTAVYSQLPRRYYSWYHPLFLLLNRLTLNVSHCCCRRMGCGYETILTVYRDQLIRSLFEHCSDVRVVRTSVFSFCDRVIIASWIFT